MTEIARRELEAYLKQLDDAISKGYVVRGELRDERRFPLEVGEDLPPSLWSKYVLQTSTQKSDHVMHMHVEQKISRSGRLLVSRRVFYDLGGKPIATSDGLPVATSPEIGRIIAYHGSSISLQFYVGLANGLGRVFRSLPEYLTKFTPKSYLSTCEERFDWTSAIFHLCWCKPWGSSLPDAERKTQINGVDVKLSDEEHLLKDPPPMLGEFGRHHFENPQLSFAIIDDLIRASRDAISVILTVWDTVPSGWVGFEAPKDLPGLVEYIDKRIFWSDLNRGRFPELAAVDESLSPTFSKAGIQYRPSKVFKEYDTEIPAENWEPYDDFSRQQIDWAYQTFKNVEVWFRGKSFAWENPPPFNSDWPSNAVESMKNLRSFVADRVDGIVDPISGELTDKGKTFERMRLKQELTEMRNLLSEYEKVAWWRLAGGELDGLWNRLEKTGDDTPSRPSLQISGRELFRTTFLDSSQDLREILIEHNVNIADILNTFGAAIRWCDSVETGDSTDKGPAKLHGTDWIDQAGLISVNVESVVRELNDLVALNHATAIADDECLTYWSNVKSHTLQLKVLLRGDPQFFDCKQGVRSVLKEIKEHAEDHLWTSYKLEAEPVVRDDALASSHIETLVLLRDQLLAAMANPQEGFSSNQVKHIDSQQTADTGTGSDLPAPLLTLAVRNAYRAFHYVELMIQRTPTDREALEYLEEHGVDERNPVYGDLSEYATKNNLPNFQAFRKSLGKARNSLGQQKKKRRGPGPSGRSIVSAQDL